MSEEDTWDERDTSADRIEAALRGLLRERHASDETLVPARVLNLVVIVDRDWKGEIHNRLDRVGRYNASRTILCAVQEGRRSLDARVVMSSQASAGGTVGVIRERVEMDIGSRHLSHIETIIDPLIASDLPTVLWAPHGHLEAVGDLLELIDVILLDSDVLEESDEPTSALAHAGELRDRRYVVDLAWLRTQPWRERLAASFDPPARRGRLETLDCVSIRFNGGSTVSALLLAGWLASRMGWETRSFDGESGKLRGMASEVRFEFEPVDQGVPGIAGVTVSSPDGFALSLDRARGGLKARQECGDGPERTWQVLGASRGEGGILGEGVRQALLRDPTYEPALVAAKGFSL